MPTTTTNRSILIVEDERVFARAVQRQLNRSGYSCETAENIGSAYEKLSSLTVDLILLDMRLPDGSGLDFLQTIKTGEHAGIAVIVMSAYGEIDDAVSAMKIGASDYLKKPVDLEELLLHVESVLARNALEAKLAYSNKRESSAVESVQLIGECPQIRAIKKQVEQIAQLTYASDATPPTVMILGQTGTGKDVMARFLHASAALRDRPFVQIDCASLPRDIIEAELFGHEKGAFTNAHLARTGLIEAAEDGTLFIDEIGELPLELQSKLLAVLERRLLRRIGANKEISTRAWFIVATNKQLEELVKNGQFRADLYYRFNVFSITMPPLMERGEDIMVLAKHFAQYTAQRYDLGTVSFSAQASKRIMEYSWPGNVREMKHLVERAVLLSNGGVLSAEVLNLPNNYDSNHLPTQNHATNSATDMSAVESKQVTLESAERSLLKRALEEANGNVSKSARQLGITRMAMRYKMKKYNLG